MAKRLIFAETTPLGGRVVLTRDGWRLIVRFKHPALAGHAQLVRQCVRDPEVIRVSQKDGSVHLHYRRINGGYLCVVVGGANPRQRIVITAYFTKVIKEGGELWTK
ncbi:MAG: DUF4258 domain-containing protein [Planctomycetia bacterium]|nr:DUF4258 domain-containing protein [Planctomycetia bacterium]